MISLAKYNITNFHIKKTHAHFNYRTMFWQKWNFFIRSPFPPVFNAEHFLGQVDLTTSLPYVDRVRSEASERVCFTWGMFIVSYTIHALFSLINCRKVHNTWLLTLLTIIYFKFSIVICLKGGTSKLCPYLSRKAYLWRWRSGLVRVTVSMER